MNTDLDRLEAVSALMDGQLRGDEFAVAVESVAADLQARSAWHAYHVVGEVLRSGDTAVCGSGTDFVERFRARLQAAPLPDLQTSVPGRDLRGVARADAANDGVFRWKLIAGLASLATVAVLGWVLVAPRGTRSPGAEVAIASSPVSVQAVQPVVVVPGGEPQMMIRDPRLDELLAAHKQFGGASALQTPAGFLRNATFEGPAR